MMQKRHCVVAITATALSLGAALAAAVITIDTPITAGEWAAHQQKAGSVATKAPLPCATLNIASYPNGASIQRGSSAAGAIGILSSGSQFFDRVNGLPAYVQGGPIQKCPPAN